MGAGWATGPQVPQLKDHVSPGVFFSPLEFGNMQKINQPDVVCEDPEETVALASCSEHVSPLILGGGVLAELASEQHAHPASVPSAPSVRGC